MRRMVKKLSSSEKKAVYDCYNTIATIMEKAGGLPGNLYIKQFRNVVNTFGEKNVVDLIGAEIVSHPNYVKMKRDGLAIAIEKLFFEVKMVKKNPALKKPVRMSDVAYNALVYRSREQLYDYYTWALEVSGAYKKQEVRETTGRGLGRFINSITGA